MKQSIKTLAKGTAGITSLQLVGEMPSPETIQLIFQLLSQIAIGVATVWSIFRKPKKVKDEE